MTSRYKLHIQSKLAFMLACLGFVIITLIPYIGALIGIVLVLYSIYLSEKVLYHQPHNALAKAGAFLSFGALAFLFSIGMMFTYIVYLA